MYFRIDEKKYKKTTILKNLGFGVDLGEMIAVFAPSGTGKSTLIKCLSHRAKYQGDIYTNNKYFNPALVEQENTLDRQETIMESVYYSMRLSNLSLSKDNAIYNSRLIIESLRLLDFAYKKIADLSGGQMRRVQIAQALSQTYDCLILDEPDSGLDILSSNKLINDLGDIAHKLNKNVVVISHNVMNLYMYDQIMLLSKGPDGAASIAYYGKPKYLQSYFQTDNMLDVFQKIEDGKDPKGNFYTKTYKDLSTKAKEQLRKNKREDSER